MYSWLFVLDGVTCFIAIATLFLVLGHRNVVYPKPEKNIVKGDSPYRDKILILFLFLNLINMLAFFQILFAVPVYFKEELLLDENIIGVFFTINGLLIFILEMPIVFVIEKTGKFFRAMIWGAILIGISYASLSIFSAPLLAIGMYSLLVAIGEVINFPFIPGMAMRRASENNQGKYMGLVSMMFAMALTLAPITGLPVVEIVGFNTYFYIAAGLSLISAVGLRILEIRY